MNALPWHADAWARLQARRTRNALPHALLLAGAPGLGKRAFAQRFVHGLLCLNPLHGDACGGCRSCLLLAAGSHPDWVTLTFGLRRDKTLRSEIIVEQIRELSARLAMTSQFGGWQIATIDPADAMNPSAANALLKTLEEPTASTILLLLADAPWRLPQTIRSRCQRVDFELPNEEQALAWLREHDVADAPQALQAAGGNPGLALAWSRDGALQHRHEVRQAMAALATGRTEPLSVVRQWLDGDPAQCLWFAAQAAADERKARVTGTAVPLGSVLADEALDHWYAAANRARESLRGPLRNDLLLLDLLTRWR